MPKKPESVKGAIGAEGAQGGTHASVQERTAAESAEARRTMIDATVKDIMSKHDKLLKKLVD